MSAKIGRLMLGLSAAAALMALSPAVSLAVPAHSSDEVEVVPVTPAHDNQNTAYPSRTWKVVHAPYMKETKIPASVNMGSCTDGYNPSTGGCN